MTNIKHADPTIKVGSAVGPTITSSAECALTLPNVPADFPTSGHIMEGFHENVVEVGLIFDAQYSVLFTKDAS